MSFAVGEIAEIISTINFPEYNGEECVVIGDCGEYPCWATREHSESCDEFGYPVRLANGHEFVVPPERLRKKRPPSEYDGNTRTTWDDLIVWKPKELVMLWTDDATQPPVRLFVDINRFTERWP